MITEQTEKDIDGTILDRNTSEELVGIDLSIKVLISCIFDKLESLELEATRLGLNEYIQNQINDTIRLMFLIEEQRTKAVNLLDPILKELGI